MPFWCLKLTICFSTLDSQIETQVLFINNQLAFFFSFPRSFQSSACYPTSCPQDPVSAGMGSYPGPHGKGILQAGRTRWRARVWGCSSLTGGAREALNFL